MNKRDVVRLALEGKPVPYVPWSCWFTSEAHEKLAAHFGTPDVDRAIDNHIFWAGGTTGSFEDIGNDCVRDYFGVVWDRSQDKDIGMVQGQLLPEQTLANYTFPDPAPPGGMDQLAQQLEQNKDRFSIYAIGFSLYERAWTLRGMESLMMDFYTNPDFVHELFNAIADFNIAQVKAALQHDFDAVYFGDDWGKQSGLLMGYPLWKEFIYPVIKRMYREVRDAGKYVFIHSCGDVDELFDDLVGIGLNCFNPFQPEVMDVHSLMVQYRGKLSFHGGLSTQRTLPYGSTDDVRRDTQKLLELGRAGNYIFAPAHAVEGDVPLANMLVFLDEIQTQPGWVK